MVQVKAAQGDRVALSSGPDHLIVLHLSELGVASVVFNGPGPLAWSAVGKKQKNGQSPISVKRLGAHDQVGELELGPPAVMKRHVARGSGGRGPRSLRRRQQAIPDHRDRRQSALHRRGSPGTRPG